MCRLCALKAFAAGERKNNFLRESGNFYRTSLICVVLLSDTTAVPSWGASLVFNIIAYAWRFHAASAWRIFYISYRKRLLGQTPDAARKCGQLWILIRWNFNLWIFPSFLRESRDKPRDVTSLDLDQWKTFCAFSAQCNLWGKFVVVYLCFSNYIIYIEYVNSSDQN